MGREPAGDGREQPGEVEAQEDQRRAPPVATDGALQADALAVVAGQPLQVVVELLVEAAVADDQVGLQVQRQAERVEVAGAHRGPLVVGQRHLAVQRPLAVFEDFHPVAQQVVVEHAREAPGPGHVRLALEDQGDAHAAARRVAHLAQQAVAGEEVGVGHHQPLPGRADGLQVLGLDVPAVALVVAYRQQHARAAGRVGLRAHLAGRVQRRAHQAQAGAVQVGDDRPGDFHRIVLLGHRTEVAQVVGRVVDAADEGALAVDHHDLAVQAAEQVGAHAQPARAGVEHVDVDPGAGHGGDVLAAELGGAVAVHRQLHPHAAAGGVDQHLLQFVADLVLVDDEGLDQHFVAGRADALEHPGVVLLAVDQQPYLIAFAPVVTHRWISTARGAWSERWDQGWLDSTTGSWLVALRT